MGGRRRLAGASAVLAGVLVAGVASAFVVGALVRDWDEVRGSLDGARPGWIVLAVLFAAAGMTSIAVPWRRALRLLGGELSGAETVARYYLGEIGKYVPGGIWPVVGRGELARRGGVARAVAYSSVALSLATLYLAAMFLVVLAAPSMLGDADPGGYLWVLAILPLGVVGLHPVVLGRAKKVVEKLLRRRIDMPIPPWRDTLTLIGLYAPAWLFVGTATWMVALALGADAGWLDVAPAAVLSWVVGFVLVPAPGGVGVREAAFVAAVGSVDPGLAAAIAILTRIVFIVVDSVGALWASAWLARRLTVRQDYAAESARLTPPRV